MTLTNSEMKDLFLKIYFSANANELHLFIEKHPILGNKGYWTPFGDEERKYNSGTFEGQMNKAITALIEKPINSIDSILMKECRLNGVEPENKHEAPKTMKEAVESFFHIKNGDWSVLEQKERRQTSENIQIIASGDSKKTPNIAIYDDGEGQEPGNFKNTFLSIQKGNKVKVPFTQGKYNMGSHAAISFCDGHKYQLIVSRKSNKLSGGNNKFGFVLARKHILTDEELNEFEYKSSWYEYFAPEGEVLEFEADELELDLHGRTFKEGTIVKLYSYKLESPSDVTLDLWKDLNQFLYQPAMPILLVEARKDKFGKLLYKGRDSAKGETARSKVMLGNKARILIDERNNVEKSISIYDKSTKIGKLSIEAHVFAPEVNRNEFVKEKAVIFTINGQVQGYLGRGFVSKELGLNNLRDSMLVHVNCTDLSVQWKDEIFMARRDDLKDTPETKELIKTVQSILKNNEELLEIEGERRKRLIRQDTANDSVIRKVLSKAPIKKELFNLFKQKSPFMAMQWNSDKHKVKESVEINFLSEYPTYLKLVKSVNKIPINMKGSFLFETDAMDDFFIRTCDPGMYYLAIDRSENAFDFKVEGPSKGKIKLTLQPNESLLSVGEKFYFEFVLTGKGNNEFSEVFSVEITEPDEKNIQERKREKPLPTPMKIYSESWEEYGFTKTSIAKIIPKTIDDKLYIEAVAINMDSSVLESYFETKKVITEDEATLVKEKYFTLFYLEAISTFQALQKQLFSKNFQTDREIDELVSDMLEETAALKFYMQNEQSMVV